MTNSTTFLGEVEILQNSMPEEDFGKFENLLNLGVVHELAHEFSDFLELMPYQELGKQMELSLAVYLRPKFADGRIIAIVGRDKFPENGESLSKIVTQGINRLELLRKGTGHLYEEESMF